MAGNLTAARSGDRRKALEELRDTLAGLLDTSEANVHAQLAAQYRATLADLAAMAPAKGATTRDELKARRAARSSDRGAEAKPAASAGRGRKL